MYGLSVRVLPSLLAPTARVLPWAPLLTATGLGLAIVSVPAAMSVTLGPPDLSGLLRAAAVCGALGMAFGLDDPAARSLETVPTPRPLRYAVRVATLVAAAAAWWAVALAVTVAGAEQGIGAALPLRGLTLEAAGIAAVALAVAAVRLRLRPDGGGLVAAPAVLALVLAASALPQRVALFVSPDSDLWRAAHERWVVVLALAVGALAWASRQ